MFIFNAFLSDNSCSHLLQNDYFTTCFPYVQKYHPGNNMQIFMSLYVYLDGTYPNAFTQLFSCEFPRLRHDIS